MGDMATMDHNASIAGADDGSPDEQPNYLHLAWLLQEKLNDLIDSGKPPGLELQSMLNLAVSQKVISYDPRMMNPALWRNLPPELLVLVFARLPLPEIGRLHCLSRKWHRDMAAPDSVFNRACADAHPNLVARLSFSGDWGNVFRVRMFDFRKNTWQYCYDFQLRDINGGGWTLMEAHDGGLLCLVSNWKSTDANPLAIVVMNLLTRVQHELPRLYYRFYRPPTMVQIKVDPETKHYRVFVVRKTRVRLRVEVYDSRMKKWMKEVPPVGLIFGYADKWRQRGDRGSYELASTSGCAFDSVAVTLKVYKLHELLERVSDIYYAIDMDRKFVLREVEQDRNDIDSSEMLPAVYCISEYQAQNNAENWVQVGTHQCPAFGNYSNHEYDNMVLQASEGILVVTIWSAGKIHFWHLNLHTGVWCELPEYSPRPWFFNSVQGSMEYHSIVCGLCMCRPKSD